jgi:hypothetical protein
MAVTFNDTPFWQAPDPKRKIEGERARRHGLYLFIGLVAKSHNRHFAKLLLYDSHNIFKS